MYERATSAFPISIATSLALESIFIGRQDPYDPSRSIPNQVDIRQYQQVWFNIKTLIRNIIGAMSDSKIMNPQEILDILSEEIEIIKDIFRVEGAGIAKPIFYTSEYIKTKAPHVHQAVKVRPANTPAQILYHKNEELILKSFFKHIDKKDDQHLQFKDLIEVKAIDGTKPKALIVTHFPYDLLSYGEFDKLDLLESHTGVLKSREIWSSKLYKVPNGNMNLLPFIRKTLLVFGDNNMFRPMPIELRRQILDIAERRKWNGLTTKDKVMLDINLDIADKYIVSVIASL